MKYMGAFFVASIVTGLLQSAVEYYLNYTLIANIDRWKDFLMFSCMCWAADDILKTVKK